MLQFLFDVTTEHLGQRDATVAFVHLYQRVAAFECVVVALQRRGGRSQQHLGLEELGQYQGHVPRLVSGSRVVLFVAGLVLLVHNDQSEFFERQKHRRARTHHHIITPRCPVQHVVPNFYPFVGVELGMVHTNPFAKNFFETRGKLGGQGDFGHQKQHLLTAGDGFLHQGDVHLCFARSGDPVQQHRGFFLPAGEGFLVGCVLCRAEGGGSGCALGGLGHAVHNALFQHQYVFVGQLTGDRGIGTGVAL